MITLFVSDGAGGQLPFTLVGSSLKTSAHAGERLYQLSIFPGGREGIVIIQSDQTGEVAIYQVEVEKEGKVKIDPDKVFVSPDRIVQVYPRTSLEGQPWIEVEIGKHRFTSNPNRNAENTHFVSDVNLLCRYWVGNAEPGDVADAATEFEEKESLRQQLEKTQIALAKKEQELAYQRVVAENYSDLCLSWMELAGRLSARLALKWKFAEDKKLIKETDAELRKFNKTMSTRCN